MRIYGHMHIFRSSVSNSQVADLPTKLRITMAPEPAELRGNWSNILRETNCEAPRSMLIFFSYICVTMRMQAAKERLP